MNILLYISIIYTNFFFSQPEPPKGQLRDICKLYGSVYVETNNRNRADLAVYVDHQASFPALRVFVQENSLYADKPGHWYFTKDFASADFVIYIEKEDGRTRNVISYTETESQAGCQ